ncbi:MAG TPA: DUF308 domain-containing protein [Kofleriaceae bacterium]|nr:DUF308 domain-containing protein [Kofleriaceae bacterium]
MTDQPTWRWWTIALRGLATVLFGALAIAIGLTGWLVLLFGAYALIDGVLAISIANAKVDKPRGVIMARGLVSIGAALVTLLWPGMSRFALAIVIALWAIAAGVLEMATASRMRKELRHEWLTGFEGMLSVSFGWALLVATLAGVRALAVWVETYAFVLGAMLLLTAFQMRSYVRQRPAIAAA